MTRSDPAGPYQSRLLNLLNRQRLRWGDRLGLWVREATHKAKWGVDWLVNTVWQGLHRTPPERQMGSQTARPLPELPCAEIKPELPPCDRAIETVMAALPPDLLADAVPEASMLTLQGIASELQSRQLVVIANNNQALAVFNEREQQHWQQQVDAQMNNYWERRIRYEMERPRWLFGKSPRKLLEQAVIRADRQLVKVETRLVRAENQGLSEGATAAADLGPDSTRDHRFAQRKFLENWIRAAIDHFFGDRRTEQSISATDSAGNALPETEQRQLPGPKSRLLRAFASSKSKELTGTPSISLGGTFGDKLRQIPQSVASSLVSLRAKAQKQPRSQITKSEPGNVVSAQQSSRMPSSAQSSDRDLAGEKRTDPFSLSVLIQAAIAYFFGTPEPDQASFIASEDSGNSLPGRRPSKNLPGANLPSLKHDGIDWSVLFGSSPEKSALTTTNTQSGESSEAALVQESSFAIAAAAKSSAVSTTSSQTQALERIEQQSDRLSDRATNPHTNPLNALDTPVVDFGYEEHPLSIILGWLDQVMYWCEEIVVKLWQWLRQRLQF